MKCPFCILDKPVRDVHAHLVADHAGEIRTEDIGERMAYTVTCPYCSERYRQPIRKSAGDRSSWPSANARSIWWPSTC